MRKLALAAYLLVAGAATGLSPYFWHVWSDNAYLFVYFFALLLLVTGSAVGMAALAARTSWLVAPAVLLGVSILGFIVIDTLGTGRIVAAEFVAGGNLSQSPCIVRDRVIPPPPPQISADEARADDIRGVAGGLNQFGTPFAGGLITLLGASLRTPRGYRATARGLLASVVPIAFLYLRGPAAWCGPIFGLDTLAVTIAIAFVVARTASRGDVAVSRTV